MARDEWLEQVQAGLIYDNCQVVLKYLGAVTFFVGGRWIRSRSSLKSRPTLVWHEKLDIEFCGPTHFHITKTQCPGWEVPVASKSLCTDSSGHDWVQLSKVGYIPSDRKE